MIVFFFSSRRRHTRFDCDWSSDVCSSDLGFVAGGVLAATGLTLLLTAPKRRETAAVIVPVIGFGSLGVEGRSEERRVGKECTSGRWPYHQYAQKTRTNGHHALPPDSSRRA